MLIVIQIQFIIEEYVYKLNTELKGNCKHYFFYTNGKVGIGNSNYLNTVASGGRLTWSFHLFYFTENMVISNYNVKEDHVYLKSIVTLVPKSIPFHVCQ